MAPTLIFSFSGGDCDCTVQTICKGLKFVHFQNEVVMMVQIRVSSHTLLMIKVNFDVGNAFRFNVFAAQDGTNVASIYNPYLAHT